MRQKDQLAVISIASFLFVTINIFWQVEYFYDLSKIDLHGLDKFLIYVRETKSLQILVQIILSIVSFKFLFEYAIKSYSSPALWHAANKEESLNGYWVYTFKDTNIDTCIFGFFAIEHSMDRLRITNARCWYSGTETLTINNSRGTWRSKYIGYTDDELWLIYDMNITCLTPTCTKTISNTYIGVMKLVTNKSSSQSIDSITGHICHYDEIAKLSGPFKAKRLAPDEETLIKDWNNLKPLIRSHLGYDPDTNTHYSGGNLHTVK